MTIKELLELAAKAAGLQVERWCDGSNPYGPNQGLIIEWEHDIWNPMVDDGDALRLAVNRSMRVEVDAALGYTLVRYGDEFGDYVQVGHLGFAEAATRRAITLAAAEIGRSMK
ncbi:hypothetical protein [Pandoraea norimbergensis]